MPTFVTAVVYGDRGQVNDQDVLAAVPIDRAEVAVMTTVGVSNALAAGDQLKLTDRASAKRGV